MKILAFLFFSFSLPIVADVNLLPANEAIIELIYSAAKKGDPQSQYVIGMLHESGEGGLPRDLEKALYWYSSSSLQGCLSAQTRLGLLYFFEEGSFQNRTRGLAMVLAASAVSSSHCKEFDSLRQLMQLNMTQTELQIAFDLAADWIIEHSSSYISHPFSNAFLRRASHSENRMIPILDRWVPAEANERVYGPGTHDGNQGVLKSEYEKMQQEVERFVAKFGDLKNQIVSIEHAPLQEKLETLRKESENLKSEAVKSAAIAILEAMAAGLAVEALPVAILSGLAAMNDFKEAAERYCRSIDISREIEGLMKLDKSLDTAKELERDNDRRGR